MQDERATEYRECFAQLAELDREISELNADRDEIRDRLGELMAEDDIDKIQAADAGLSAIRYKKETKTFDLPAFLKSDVPTATIAAAAKSLDMKKLIESGVDPALIESCTAVTKTTEVFQVRKLAKKDAEDRTFQAV